MEFTHCTRTTIIINKCNRDGSNPFQTCPSKTSNVNYTHKNTFFNILQNKY